MKGFTLIVGLFWSLYFMFSGSINDACIYYEVKVGNAIYYTQDTTDVYYEEVRMILLPCKNILENDAAENS